MPAQTMHKNTFKELADDIDNIEDKKFDDAVYIRDKVMTIDKMMGHSALFHFDHEQDFNEPKDTQTRSAGNYFRPVIQFKAPQTGNTKAQAKSVGKGKRAGSKAQVANTPGNHGNTVAVLLIHEAHRDKPVPAAMMKSLLKMSCRNVDEQLEGPQVQIIVIRKDLTWVNETTGEEGNKDVALRMVNGDLSKEDEEALREKKIAEKIQQQKKAKGRK